MKSISTACLLFLFSFSYSQSLVVDELMIIDPSSTWPFTWDIEVTQDNTIYVGNELGKVYYREEGNDWTELILPELIESEVRKVKVDENNRIWVATDGSGLHMLDGDVWTSYTTSNSNITSDNFSNFEVNKNGNVYGGSDKGLNILIDGIWYVANEANGLLESNNIDVMGYNPTTGTTYLGGDNILYVLSITNSITKIDLDDTFGWNTRINCFYPDGAKMLIGTKKGLLSIEDTEITDLRDISGSAEINDMSMDSKGNIWFGRTFYGLSIYDGQTLHEIGSSDTIPNQIFDMIPYKDNVLLVGNRGARLASTYWEGAITSVSTQELEGLDFSPMVTDGLVHLTAENKLNQDFTCFIYSEAGIQVGIITSKHQINLSSFSSGVYYLRVKDNTTNRYYKTQKIVKI